MSSEQSFDSPLRVNHKKLKADLQRLKAAKLDPVQSKRARARIAQPNDVDWPLTTANNSPETSANTSANAGQVWSAVTPV